MQSEGQAADGKINPETPGYMLDVINAETRKAYHVQVASEVNTPPRRGPRTVEPMKIPIQIPISRGLVLGTAAKIMIKTEPLKVPEQPRPWMARPTIRAMEFGAGAATTLPIRHNTRAFNRSWKVGEQLPPRRTGSSNENKAGRAIPGNVVEGLEVFGDSRNGCGHDTLKGLSQRRHFLTWMEGFCLASYQIQSGNHGAQVDGRHDGEKLEGCGILQVVVRLTQRCLALLVFFVVSHGRAILLGVLFCAVLTVFNALAGGRHGCVCNSRSFDT